MVPPLRMKPGTRKLSDIARHVVVPSGIVSTGWPAVAKKAAEVGLGADDWQVGIGKLALAKRADGKFAAGIGGVVLSIPRQVGKTYLVSLIVFCLCLLTPGLTVLWTAHRMKTAGETFAKLQAFTRKKKIAPHILKVTTGAGDEVVYFRNGSRILFGARERGFGRGFDNVDVEVFDEAQILTEAAVEDMVPATNVAANPLLFFIGTPPRPKDPGEIFTGKRKEALAGEDEDTVYVEFSADPSCNENDRKQWAKANPSYPSRTDDAAMLRMKKALNTPGSFEREALGIWDEDGGEAPISATMWDALAIEVVPEDWPLASIGLDMNPERTRVSIAVAAFAPEHVHVELAEDAAFSDAGSAALVDWIVERAGRRIPVVIDAYSPARSLEPELKKRRCMVRIMGAAELSQACGGLYDAVTLDGSVTHFGQARLDQSLAGATKENFGPAGAWKWNRKSLDVDLSPLMAVTAAHFGAVKFGRRRRVRDESTRRTVIL